MLFRVVFEGHLSEDGYTHGFKQDIVFRICFAVAHPGVKAERVLRVRDNRFADIFVDRPVFGDIVYFFKAAKGIVLCYFFLCCKRMGQYQAAAGKIYAVILGD